jgi:hypothetical protein
MGEMLMSLVTQDGYLSKRKGMEILYDLLIDEENKAFTECFLMEDEYLEFSMEFLHDDSIHIRKEAFLLLFLFLESAEERRAEKVNASLRKHRDKLLELIDEFMREYKSIDRYFYCYRDTAVEALCHL